MLTLGFNGENHAFTHYKKSNVEFCFKGDKQRNGSIQGKLVEIIVINV